MVDTSLINNISFSVENHSKLRNLTNASVNVMRIKKFVKQEARFNRYLTELNKEIEATNNSDDKSILTQHLKELKFQMQEGRRVYSENILRMKYDELNELDRVGLARYSREYQIVYSLENHLAEIVGAVFKCDPEEIRETLSNNLNKQGLTYQSGSRAILSNCPTMIEGLTYGWYLDLHPNIDYKLSKLLTQLEHSKFEDIFGDQIIVEHLPDNPEIKFGLMMGILINKYSESIILTLLEKLEPFYKTNYDRITIFTSKSLNSIVINSNEDLSEEDLTATLNVEGVMIEIKPTVSKLNQYYTTLI